MLFLLLFGSTFHIHYHLLLLRIIFSFSISIVFLSFKPHKSLHIYIILFTSLLLSSYFYLRPFNMAICFSFTQNKNLPYLVQSIFSLWLRISLINYIFLFAIFSQNTVKISFSLSALFFPLYHKKVFFGVSQIHVSFLFSFLQAIRFPHIFTTDISTSLHLSQSYSTYFLSFLISAFS